MNLSKSDLKKLGFIDIDPSSIDLDNIDTSIIDKLDNETRLSLEKEYQSLNLSNDFLFCCVMSDSKICKMLLEEILNISIEKIVYNEEQKSLSNEFLDKGVRFDVYVNDSKGTIYNIEMQTADTKDLAERSRYYQGSIDVNSLKKGGLYKDLKNSYVIFICCFDPFKRGGFKYTFRNSCDEYSGLFLEDGAVKIFLNTKGFNGNISRELEIFLKYTENSTETLAKSADSGLVREIHKKVTEMKESTRLGVNYMTMTMRDRLLKHEYETKGIAKGRAEGIAEGIAEGMAKGEQGKALSIAGEMLKENFAVEVISKMTKLSYDEIYELQKTLNAS